MAKKIVPNLGEEQKCCSPFSSKKSSDTRKPEILWPGNGVIFDMALEQRAHHLHCLIHSSIQLSHIVWNSSEKQPQQRELIQRCSDAILALLRR